MVACVFSLGDSKFNMQSASQHDYSVGNRRPVKQSGLLPLKKRWMCPGKEGQNRLIPVFSPSCLLSSFYKDNLDMLSGKNVSGSSFNL